MKTFKEELNSRIGFLNWVELHPDDVRDICYDDIGRVFLSPDVHSLHVVWEEVEPDGSVYKVLHEITDYPYELFCLKTLTEWLEGEIGDDSRYSFRGQDVLSLISDYGSDFTKEKPPARRLVELVELV